MGHQGTQIISIPFQKSDAAAEASTFTNIPPAGLPDTTDVAEVVMPSAGFVVGIGVQANPSSGDTVIVEMSKNTVGNAAITATATNAAPAAHANVAEGAGVAFNAGDTLGILYKTTTGGTYTASDLYGVLYVAIVLDSNMVHV